MFDVLFSFLFFSFLNRLLSKLDHPGLAKLVAAHAKPPKYMFFFEFYECPNLADKLHVKEWTPSIYQVLMIAIRLGMAVLSRFSLLLGVH